MRLRSFMTSDQRTTADPRGGGLLLAVVVAPGAGIVPVVLYRAPGLLWSMVVCVLLVQFIDRLLHGRRYQWQSR